MAPTIKTTDILSMKLHNFCFERSSDLNRVDFEVILTLKLNSLEDAKYAFSVGTKTQKLNIQIQYLTLNYLLPLEMFNVSKLTLRQLQR